MKTGSLDKEQIISYLPHREPFLFVDKILEIHTNRVVDKITGKLSLIGSYTIAEKTFLLEENSFYRGHFPREPITPAVILLEAMAQASLFVFFPSLNKNIQLPSPRLAAIKEAKFHKKVLPGDRTEIVSELIHQKSNFFTFKIHTKVKGELVAKSKIMAHSEKFTDILEKA